jgi:antitoxin HicB
MFYRAKIFKDGDGWGVEFPDCPGCFTCADTVEEARAAAAEAVEGWLNVHLSDGLLPPKPKAKKGEAIAIPAKLAIALQVRWAREEQGLTQAQLAKAAGLTRQQVARLENPENNPTLENMAAVAQALGMHVELVA